MNRKFNTHGGYFTPRGYSKVEAGGKHHENPNGGVQYGVDAQGVPNMLEEGEPVYDDFVYSDNIEADADFLAKYNLPAKFAGKLYSEIADAFVDEAAERPLDPTSNNGLNKMLARLADAQEAQKQSQQQNDLQTELDGLSPEEMQQLQTMLAGSGQEQGQPMGMEDTAMMQQQMMAQPQMMPQEAAMAPEGVMARGGFIRRFAEGGDAFEEGQGLSLAQPKTLWLMPSDEAGNLYDTIQPAVVTAPLPNGMTQHEARNRMEGYLFGQQVARGRDQWGRDALALADQATGGLIIPLSLASSMANGDALGMGLNMAAAMLPFTAVLPADEAAKAVAQAKKLSTAKGQATRKMNKLAKEIQVAEEAGDVAELARLKKLHAEQKTLWKKAADESDELNKIRQPKPEIPAAHETPASQTTPSASSQSPAPQAVTPASKKKELWIGKEDPRYAAYKNEISWTKGADKNKARNANILWNPIYNTRKLWQSELPFTQKAVLTGRDLLWTPNIPANVIRTANPIGSAVNFFQTEKPHGYINGADTTEFTEPVLYHTGEVKRPNSYDEGGPVLVNDWPHLPVSSSGSQVVPAGEEASGENEHPVSIVADASGQVAAQQLPVVTEATATEDTNPSSQRPAARQSGGFQYSTWPMYAGAINAGLSGLYNAFQKPDRYDYGTYVPNIPSVQAPHFVNPTFTPDDENRYVHDLLSQGASMVRAMQSSPGGSSRAALIAANNAIMKNLADARAKVRSNNIAQRNTVTQSRNANASALANFNMTNAQNRSNIMNAAQQYNLERLAQQQAANYAAEGQKYAALQSNINAMADALAGIGRQNATLNRINNDSTFDYSTFLNGTTIKKGQ